MITLDSHFSGTYARNLLSDWAVISEMMRQRSTWVKEKIQIQEMGARLDEQLITDRQFDDTFNGPLQEFFRRHLKCYATISKIETALTISKEDFSKESEHTSDLTLGIPLSFLEKNDFSKLKALRDQLDTITKEHYTQWETALQEWEALLPAELKENNIVLTEMELQDFTVNQPISELEDRFVSLNLTIPKLKKAGFNFHQYFVLKITLAIQSVSNREHTPRSDKEIEQRLKLFKKMLKTIHEIETMLCDTQKKALEALMKPVQF